MLPFDSESELAGIRAFRGGKGFNRGREAGLEVVRRFNVKSVTNTGMKLVCVITNSSMIPIPTQNQ